MRKLKIVFWALFTVLIIPNTVFIGKIQAPTVEAKEALIVEEILSPDGYADKYALQYGVDPVIFKKVMRCESNNNPLAIGDGGMARNVMQFHKQTFDGYSKMFYDKFGRQLYYDSYKDQIELAVWMFSNGEQHHWTCYKMIGGI